MAVYWHKHEDVVAVQWNKPGDYPDAEALFPNMPVGTMVVRYPDNTINIMSQARFNARFVDAPALPTDRIELISYLRALLAEARHPYEPFEYPVNRVNFRSPPTSALRLVVHLLQSEAPR